MHWFDTNLLGKYDLSERWIGLDYKKLFLDPVLAEITYAHEVTHAVLAMQTDFGQFTNVFFRLQDNFNKIHRIDIDSILELLIKSQVKVQEGFATFMQISILWGRTNKQNALAYADKKLPDTYKKYLEPLKFGFELSKRYRDFFTAKVSILAMETGIRKAIWEQDLLSDTNKLVGYILNEDNNPNLRLLKICDTLKIKSWLVTKDAPIISKECGVKFYDPATKEELANFLSYITSFTESPQLFTAIQIGETPQGIDAFAEASKNIIVSNLNLKIAETAQTFFKIDDFLKNAKDIELIFINPFDKNWEDINLLKLLSGTEPEIAIGGFTKDDRKFLTITSKGKALVVINNDLKDTTLFVKWGGYDFLKNQLIWSNNTRPPDLVVYNNIEQLQIFLGKVVLLEEIKFKHLHIGAGKDHPFQTLLIKINNLPPLHVVNCLGNKEIGVTLKMIESKTQEIIVDELRNLKKHINNLMCFWMGMPWDIDWVETMINGKDLKFRE